MTVRTTMMIAIVTMEEKLKFMNYKQNSNEIMSGNSIKYNEESKKDIKY